MIAILEAKRAGLLTRAHFWNNIFAGLIVGVVALPLAMAFAIASGAKPEQGLYTAIVAGLATSLFGGTRVQISGPTGAFIVVLSGITAQHGIDGLQVATLMAGFMLLAMGWARLGSVIRFIPDPVIVGFTSGIAVIIWVGQWKDFFGLAPAPSGLQFHEKIWALLRSFHHIDLPTTAIAMTALAILILGNRVLDRIPGMRRVPAPLVAMLVATAVQALVHFPSVATIGSAFGGLPRTLPQLHVPTLTFTQMLTLVGPAFTIALLGAIESLLAAVVADGMADTHHNPNQELIGQGAANILAPLFGGFAATGAIARTATNIRNGASSPVAGIVHAVFLILVIVLLAPLAANIPLAALAAILFFVAWNMSDAKHFIRLLLHFPRADRAVLLITFTLTVFVDLVVAVNVGVVVATLFFMRRMASTVNIEVENPPTAVIAGEGLQPTLPAGVMMYRIEGPFFFGAAEKLASVLERVQAHVDVVVLRMNHVPFMDATGLETLREIVERFNRRKVRVVLCDVQPNVLLKLQRVGVARLLGPKNILREAELGRSLGGGPS